MNKTSFVTQIIFPIQLFEHTLLKQDESHHSHRADPRFIACKLTFWVKFMAAK